MKIKTKFNYLLVLVFLIFYCANLIAQGKTVYPYADNGEGKYNGYKLSKASWQRITNNNLTKKADKIIIGIVKEIIDTPDDDFYFHQATIAVEKTLKGDTGEKDLIVKYVHPVGMSNERFLRSRNWKGYIRNVYKMEPEEFVRKLNSGLVSVPGQSGSNAFKFKLDQKVLLYLTGIPFSIHSYYDDPYNKETDFYIGVLGNFSPISEEHFYEIQECKGYYEIISKYNIDNNGIVTHDNSNLFKPRKIKDICNDIGESLKVK